MVLARRPQVTCWTAAHAPYAVPAMSALLFYSGTALFVACYRGNTIGKKSDILFKPRFVVMERMIKNLFVISVVFIVDKAVAFSIASFFLAILLALHIKVRPCSWEPLNRFRNMTLGMALWLGLCAVYSELSSSDDSFNPETENNDPVPLILVLVGWVFILVSGCVFVCRSCRDLEKRCDAVLKRHRSKWALSVGS